jgi:hypothetical protein
MNTQAAYYIVWRGQRNGPFTLDDIQRDLATGRISLSHLVETGHGLVTVRELLEEQSRRKSVELRSTPEPAVEAPRPPSISPPQFSITGPSVDENRHLEAQHPLVANMPVAPQPPPLPEPAAQQTRPKLWPATIPRRVPPKEVKREPRPPDVQQIVAVNAQPQMVFTVPAKSMGIAILLTVLFGPLGMLYSTVPGSIIMMIISICAGVTTAGFGLLVTWPICLIWAALATSSYNNRLLQGQRRY